MTTPLTAEEVTAIEERARRELAEGNAPYGMSVPNLCETIRNLRMENETLRRGWQATSDMAERQATRIAELEVEVQKLRRGNYEDF